MDQAIQRVRTLSNYDREGPKSLQREHFTFHRLSPDENYIAFSTGYIFSKILITHKDGDVLLSLISCKCVAWSPNSRFVAVAGACLLIFDMHTLGSQSISHDDDDFEMYAQPSHTVLYDFGSEKAMCIDWSPDGKLVAVVCHTRLCVFPVNPETMIVLHKPIVLELVNGLHSFSIENTLNHILLWSPDSLTLAFSAKLRGIDVGTFWMWSTKDILEGVNKCIAPTEILGTMFEKLAWSPDSRYILGFRMLHMYSTRFILIGVKTKVYNYFDFSGVVSDGHARFAEWSPEGNLFVINESDCLKIVNVADLTIEWSDRNNHLFAGKFRKDVFNLMCIRHRLESTNNSLPKLPMVLWLNILHMFRCSCDRCVTEIK